MKDTPAVQDAEGAAASEQGELEKLYDAFNNLLADNESLEQKNIALQKEVESLNQRIGRDNQDSMKYAISEFAGDMISVADNIRRAIEAVPKEQLGKLPALKSLVEGIEVTERSLLTALNRYGVTRFDPLGAPFNPHLHEAKFTVSAPDVPVNTVVQVIHAGFLIGDRLLRPAGVAVSQAGAAQQPKDTVRSHGRSAQHAQTSERSCSVLHLPVIPAAEEAVREQVGNRADYTPEPEPGEPLLAGQETVGEAGETPLASGPVMATEGGQHAIGAVNIAFEAKNYVEAARLQEAIAGEVRRAEIAAEGRAGAGTLDALLSLSWFQLFAGQYDTVIAIADQAAAISKDYISIDTNRAHALMLKGSLDEARFIYNKHRGKETRNKKVWDSEVLDDFIELEQAGIKHPLVEDIRRAWTVKS
jgi:molecular chaperone GrpE